MGIFDDLIPTTSKAGLFDDLIPAPDLPTDPGALSLGDMAARIMPPTQPVTVPDEVPLSAAFDMPQVDPAKMDRSTAAGDLEAGMLQLQQVIPSLKVASAAQKIGVADRAMTANSREAASLREQADALEVELPNLPEDMLADVSEQISFLRNRADQFDMTDALSGAEFRREQNTDLINDAAARAAAPAQRVGELGAQISNIPMNPAAAAVLDPQGDGFWEKTGDALSSLASDPVDATRSLFLRTAPQLIPVAAASVAGFIAGGPGGAAAAGGVTGGGLEMGANFGQELIEVLTEAKIDPKDQAAVSAFLTENPGILDEALTDSAARGVIIGSMDAVSGGIVGQMAKVARTRPQRVAAAAGGGVAETATEGAGEAMAQAATEGEINPGDVLAEMIGAGPVGAVTSAANVAVEADKTPGRVLGRELGKLVEQAMLDAAPVAPTPVTRVLTPTVAPNQPEPPQQEELPDDPVDRGTDERRVAGMGAPVGVGGNTEPAVTEIDNQAGGQDPAAVFATRRTGGAERAVGPIVDEGGIGAEPVDQRAPDLNGEELAPSEQAPADVPLPKEPERPQAKPLTNIVQRQIGKIDPDGPVGQELKNRGVTPRTAPSLFRKGGLTDLDNIVGSEFPDIAAIVGLEDDGNYLNQNGLIDAIVEEFSGRPAAIGDQAAVQAAYKAYEQELAAIESGQGYEAGPVYAAPEGVIDWKIPARDADISTGVERLDFIDGTLNAYTQEAGIELSPQERAFMVDYLDSKGGSVLSAVEMAIVRGLAYAETGQQDGQRAPDAISGEGAANPVQSETASEAEGRSTPVSGTGRRDGAVDGDRQDGQRTGTTEGGRVDQTPEGEQLVIPGAEQIPDKERAERKQQEPKRGNDAPPPKGGLFDDDARNQQSLLEQDDDSYFSGPDIQTVQADGSVVLSDNDPGPKSAKVVQDSTKLLDAPARVGRRPTGRLAPSFLAFSYTTKASVFRHAFDAAGIDPDTGTLMPLDEQLRVVSKAVERTFGIKVELPKQRVVKKNLFGRKVTEEVTSLSERKALDQLLNAYRQLQMLAHIMSIPEKAIGLPIDGNGITLSLTSGNRLKGALGMFSYGGGKRVISLPDMSNSFAHEWGHALDHYLGAMSDKPMLKGLLSRDGNLSGAPLSPKRALTEAFAHVIWSMYGNSAQAGAIVLQAQVESAQLGPDGKPTPKAKRAQKILNDIRAGKTPPMEYLSDYFKTSKAYDDQTASDGYFTDPAEMFARAFEAMIGTEVAQVSDQPQAFLSKGEWAYKDSQDTRAALTFPKDVDLAQFTLAMVNLKQAMARINLFGPSAPAAAPSNHDILSTRALLKRDPGTRIGNLKESEVAEWGRTLEILANLPQQLRSTTAAVTSGISAFYSQVIRTGAATMFALADAQTSPKAREAFTNIAKLVGKRPGKGGLVTSLWEQDVRQKSGAYVNKIEGAVKKALKSRRGSRLSKADQEQLRRLMVGDKVTNPSPELKALAADLRAILNDIWYDLQAGGVKVGYGSQYLPHIYDADKATENPTEFMARAAEVYDLMFEREVVGNADQDAQTADMKSIFKGLMKATKALTDGGRDPAPRLSEDQAAEVQSYFDDLREMARLEKSIGKLKSDTAKEKAEAALAALEDGIEDKRDAALEILREAWSEYSAENWLTRTRTGELNDFGSIGPTANFMKERVLPNEAGLIMKEFMQDNPVELITNYAFSAVKRAEYAKVFGADNEKLKNMLDAAEGASKEDVEMMKQAVAASTGRMQSSGSGMQAFKTTTFSLGNMALLSLAAMSSVAEPLTAGLRSGQSRDSLNAIGQFVFNLVRRGRKRELLELARTIGLIMPYATDTLMQNRLGADVLQGQHWLQTNMSRFFILNGLTPLTHYQRAMMLPVANAVLLRHLRSDVTGKRGIYGAWRDTIDGDKGGFANGELNELGIAKDDRADLLKWLDEVGGMPSPEDMFGPDGQMHKAAELWSRATYRFSTETIQDTLKSDRPIMANHPDHAAMYGIMSFIDAFTRNVIWRTLERGIKEGDGKVKGGAKMAANAATAVLPLGILMTGQILSSIVREAVFNSDTFMEKWESEDEDEWLNWILARGIDRTGATGRLSPVVNWITGIRYETDLTSIFAGPYAAFFLNNISDVVGVSMKRNSEATNTTEHAAARALYQAMVKPALVALISGAVPMGSLSVNIGRGALGYLSSRDTERSFADGLVGEKGAKHVGDPPWWEMGR